MSDVNISRASQVSINKLWWLSAGLLVTSGLVVIARMDFVRANPLFHAHGFCYLWEPDLILGHVMSDLLIGLSYVAISATLWYLVRTAHGDIPFSWMFIAFGSFIVACGATHFMEVITLWKPLFWVSFDVKAVTAVASVITAIALPRVVPRVLRVVEAAGLAEEGQAALERANTELERRVQERTFELQAALLREQTMRTEAQAASRSKDEFLMTVSHELRTPLTAIYGWARMLATGQIREERKMHAIQSIEQNALAQTQLITDLLDVSSAISGKLQLAVRSVDLAPILEAVIESIRPAADAKRIRILAVLDPDTGEVSGDPNRLQQVAWNLMSNAIKFTPQDGRVQVRLEQVDGHVDIIVSDTGEGIDRQFLPYVFDRFLQGDRGSTRRRGGLGLGLALVRHLVELHGGTVVAESEGKERGSTFRVLLPLRIVRHDDIDGRVHRTAHGSPVPPPPRLDGLRVLVVDDDAPSRELFGEMFQNAGAEVHFASSAPDALAALRTFACDVLVSDIEMPDEDGYALVQKIRAIDGARGQRLIAIAVTAYARDEDRVRALHAGFDGHLSKPVEPAGLVLAIAALVARRTMNLNA